jgi:anaerobic selenocysteine-containing dehydrogenase
MNSIKRGDKVVVETLRGEVHGQVVSVRMLPPDYTRPMAVCVLIPGRANTVIYSAEKVRRCS